MKSYVLNLERATQRRHDAEIEFNKYGIEFQFVNGLDWLEITDEDVIEKVHPQYISKLAQRKALNLRLYLVAWLNTQRIWQKALSEGEQVVAIFDDDAKLTHDTKSVLESIFDLKHRGQFEFDIVFLYNGKPKNKILPIYDVNREYKLGLIKYDSIGSVGYVITREAIESLLLRFPSMVDVVDVFLHSYWINGLRTYVLTPQVVLHDDEKRSCYERSSNDTFTKDFLIKHGYLRRSRLDFSFRKRFDPFYSNSIQKWLAFHSRLKTESSSQ